MLPTPAAPQGVKDSTVHQFLSRDYTKKCQSAFSKINKISLDLKPIGFEGRIAYLLENVFTEEECRELINHTEKLGYDVALINFGDTAVLAKGYRDGQRLMIDDKEFVKILFKRIGRHLPQTYRNSIHANKYKLLEINERLRFLKYVPGDSFKCHYDGDYERPDRSARTWVTLQLYLNDEMEGGETTFLAVRSRDQQLESRNRVGVTPKPGRVLVFQHNILHEGSLVTKGLKYTIRTDVLYKVDEKAVSDDDVSEKETKSCSII